MIANQIFRRITLPHFSLVCSRRDYSNINIEKLEEENSTDVDGLHFNSSSLVWFLIISIYSRRRRTDKERRRNTIEKK